MRVGLFTGRAIENRQSRIGENRFSIAVDFRFSIFEKLPIPS